MYMEYLKVSYDFVGAFLSIEIQYLGLLYKHS